MAEQIQEGKSPAGRPDQSKFIIGGVIIVAVVVYLIFSSIGGSTAYYLTVGELKAQGADALGKTVRVTGIVDGDTIEWDERNLDLRFDIVDESGRLAVAYHGIRPDMFQADAEAVVEGTLTAGGLFEASNLLLKCPSKYEESATAQVSSR